MAGLLRAPLGVSAPSRSVSSAPVSRSRLRVQGQAAGWAGVSPSTPRMREASPNTRVHAVAAPERLAGRESGSSGPPTAASPVACSVTPTQQPAHAANAILPTPADWLESARRAEDEQRREALERLMQREADTLQLGGAAAPEQQQLEQRQQQLEEQLVEEEQQQQEAAEEEVWRLERLAQSAAASTSGRAQQQQQREVVGSTRRGRVGARGRTAAPAPATPARRASTAMAAAPAAAAAVAAADLASATTIRTWLLDCATRRVRHSTRPAASSTTTSSPSTASSTPAAAPPPSQRGAVLGSGRRTLLRARPAGGAVALNPAAVEGLSEETQGDMVALIQARLPLSTGRRFRRKGAAAR